MPIHYTCERCGSNRLVREPKELWGIGQVPAANAFLLICADCDWSTPEYVWAHGPVDRAP